MEQIYNHFSDIINADKNLNAGQRSVFKLFVGLSHSKRSYRITIAKSLIALKSGVSKKTADRAVKKLIELQYLKLEKKGGRYGTDMNIYVVDDAPTLWYEKQVGLLKTKKNTMSAAQKFRMALATLGITESELAKIRADKRAELKLAKAA